jgi:hypothetical protein
MEDLDIFFNELIPLSEDELDQVGGGFCGIGCVCKK